VIKAVLLAENGEGTMDGQHLCQFISPGMQKTECEHRNDICALGQKIHACGYIASTDGNISLRLDADRILISPTQMSKAMMRPVDLVVTNMKGQKLCGFREPTSEIAIHLLIYSMRPDVNAVCHAHPPVSTGYAAANIPLNQPLLSEMILSLGSVPLAPYGTPGTPELSESIAPLLRDHDAILLANHGVVTFGLDLLTAFFRMETTEHCARITLVTTLLGRQALLSSNDVEKLLLARDRYRYQETSERGDIARISREKMVPDQ
jgi:L-fuculose-phosphate aldolase